MSGTFSRGPGKKIILPEGWVHPPCEGCGGPMDRKEGETASRWLTRTNCSRKCAASLGSRPQIAAAMTKFSESERDHAPCWGCNGPVPRRHHEALSRYMERKTCPNPDCREAYRKSAMSQMAKEAAVERARERKLQAEASAIREEVAVDWGNGFAAHNLRMGPSYGRLPTPLTRTYGGVSSVYASVGGRGLIWI